ncbi:19275_t:CDS:2, partial [Entrophospora sp. SA101]
MDIVGICIPSIELVVKIAYELHNAVENARYNKKMCIDLGDRVEAGSRALYDLYRHREERVEVFKDERFYVNLQRYLNATEEVKEFVVEITQSSGAMKYLKSISYKEKLSQIVGRYDQAIHDLSLEINTRNFKNIEILQVEIEKGFNNINSYLGTIQESLKDKQDDLKLIFEQLTALNKGKGNSPEYLVHEISLANLTDPKPDDNLDNLVHGKVFKKHLNKVIPVACVPYDEENLDKDYLKKQFFKIAWLHASVQRSNLSDILNNLAKLYKKYCIPKAKPIRKNEQSNRPHANRITNGNDTNYDDIDADNILILQLENVPESTLTLKEVKDDPNMQVEFLRYLKKAALNENPQALYQLGELYLGGKL